MNKIFFVILHYQNINDTINCINSIKKLNKYKDTIVKIVVVDNKSPNDTGIELENKYKEDKDIKIILLDKNYGFSKANNIGYEYCKNNSADLIMMSNNDILINDENFIVTLCEFYNKHGDCKIICPDIINLNGNHQNPIKMEPTSISNAYKNMIYKFLISTLMHVPILNKCLYKMEENREKKWLDNYYIDNNCNYEGVYQFVPFGAFIIFTKSWIINEKIAFPSDTFMYLEEDILSLYAKHKKYKMIYFSKLKVQHLEGRSVKNISKSRYKSLIFRYKNQALALRKYIKFIRKIRKEK